MPDFWYLLKNISGSEVVPLSLKDKQQKSYETVSSRSGSLNNKYIPQTYQVIETS